MAKNKEPCGCVSDEKQWVSRCPAHEAEAAADRARMALESLRWLMRHYDRFPNEDNLRHVIVRIKEVGSAAIACSPECFAWVGKNRAAILSHARKGIPVP